MRTCSASSIYRFLVQFSLVLGVCASALPFAFGAELQLPDHPTAHVNDYAKALNAEAFGQLEQKFIAFEKHTGHQAAVAIFPSLNENPVEDVAVNLFKKWGLGSRKENDGVLLVLSMQEHAIRIEVGYGLEGQLPDSLSGQIIRNDMVPMLKQGNTPGAVLAFENRLEQIFIQGTPPQFAQPQRQEINRPVQIVSWLIFFLLIYFLFGRGRGGGGGGMSLWPFFFLGGGGRRGRDDDDFGGGGGGGWGGGGGGQSGGGGASGQW